MKNKKIFEFLKRVQLDFDLTKYLGKLLIIDSSQTVDYVLKRYGRLQQVKIVETVVSIFKQSAKKDNELYLYLFLDEVFSR